MKASAVAAAMAWLALAPAFPAQAQESSPPVLDYADPANWAARADAERAGARVAPGASPRRAMRDVDVFFVHPTTDLSRGHYSQDMGDQAVKDWTDASVIARQAGAFNRCCRIFAPYYHQTTLGGGDVALKQKAFAFAYTDVLRAFDHYLAHDNGGRPFILAGHSQGAAHVIKLLKDRIDGSPLQGKLVAAYILGAGMAESDFGAHTTLAICETPTQTGCVVQWEAVLPIFDKARLNATRTPVCVNPLTFDRARPAAPARLAKGAVPGAPDASPMKSLRRGAVAARCEDGVLVVEPAPDLDMEPLGPTSQSGEGSMHYHDVGLFYEDVRMNADARAQAYLRRPAGKQP